MCAIAGYFGGNFSGETGASYLRLMLDHLNHRGPDGNGILVNGDVGLAHARLSIVGLADGAQPMVSTDGNLSISYNGEVFNYVELRQELNRKGHNLRSSSDTEVLLAAFGDKGLNCLADLNGDFAFAIHDRSRQRLILARDRMGVRPLFYTQCNGAVFFASEVQALLALPGVSHELDPIALDQTFTLWCPISPRTAYAAIKEVPPGQVMVLEAGMQRVDAWWKAEFPDRSDLAIDASPEDQLEELEALLMDAIRLRLRADVPVGAYLSGGLDSSLLSALAAKIHGHELRTYSLRFDSVEHDEGRWQEMMAQSIGSHHVSVTSSHDQIRDDLPRVMNSIRQPVLRTAPVPLQSLARSVRDDGMKVVLTGEGADEIFAGYDLFREAKVRRFCGRQPSSTRRPRLFQRLYSYLPGVQQQTPEYLTRFFGVGSEDLQDPLYSHRPRFKSTASAKLFFSSELRGILGNYDAAEELAGQLPEDFKRWHPLNQAQYLETRYLLPGYILSAQGDRPMMANAVEGRFPFLDHRVVAFASRLHPDRKLKGLREKHILKDVARRHVPDDIIDRPKQPYRAPDAASFAKPRGSDYLRTVLSPESLKASAFFNPVAVGKLVDKAMQGEIASFRDNSAFIGILSTQILAVGTSDSLSNSKNGTDLNHVR